MLIIKLIALEKRMYWFNCNFNYHNAGKSMPKTKE